MRRLLYLLAALLTLSAQAQTDSTALSMGLGNGLQFSLNEGDYRFRISGLLQPSIAFTKPDGAPADYFFRTKRSYLNFTARALREKVFIFVQANFSQAAPLLDAYAAYGFAPRWAVSVGQRRTFTNNREMTFNEADLQFAERAYTSQAFCANGREFGAFLEGSFGNGFIISPQLAVTSGDGANSFGTNAMDVDLGSLKYGGRLDLYPLGEFSEGNRGFAQDLRNEPTPKLLIGASGSYNRGASSPKGEGHGDFLFYNAAGKTRLPDYRKFSADLLFKFRGFSLLAEYINATAANLGGLYLDSSAIAAKLLRPGQISQYLVLGNAVNVQAGYCYRGFALNARYETLNPEFNAETGSLLQQTHIETVGLARYFKDNKLKLQANGSRLHYPGLSNAWAGELVFQVVF